MITTTFDYIDLTDLIANKIRMKYAHHKIQHIAVVKNGNFTISKSKSWRLLYILLEITSLENNNYSTDLFYWAF